MKVSASLVKIYDDFYDQRLNLQYMQLMSVGPSTFRAFRKNESYKEKGEKPSEIYRDWMAKYIYKIKKRSFERIHSDCIDSLALDWKKRSGVDLFKQKPHLVYKLVDLFFKHVPLFLDLDEDLRKTIRENSKPALDSLVYFQLKKDLPDKFKKYRLNGMGSWPDQDFSYVEWYEKCQSEIRGLVGNHPPIIYDLYAWNVGRDRKA